MSQKPKTTFVFFGIQKKIKKFGTYSFYNKSNKPPWIIYFAYLGSLNTGSGLIWQDSYLREGKFLEILYYLLMRSMKLNKYKELLLQLGAGSLSLSYQHKKIG